MPSNRTPSRRTRRQFLTITAAGAGIVLARGGAQADGNPIGSQVSPVGPTSPKITPSAHAPIPRRALGRTGAQVSILGLGGSHLGEVPDEKEAIAIVHEAIDAGINFFDNAWEYHEGRSEEILGRGLAGGWRDKAFLMTKVCTHGRKADICGMDKIETLRDNLRVAQQFEPMGADEMQRVRERCAPTATDGRFELYKVSLAFDNPQARGAHGFPIDPVQMEVKEELQHAMGTDHMK